MSWDKITAGQPEIIRAHQKDEYLQTILKNKLAEVITSLFGPRALIKYEKEIVCTAKLAYFYATTALGLQTIGEEYCHLIQVNISKRKIADAKSRYLMIFLQCAWPLLLAKVLTTVQKRSVSGSPIGEKLLQVDWPEVTQKAVTVLSRVHLALFYIDAKFYEFAKRITGIRYVVIREFLKGTFATDSYEMLGKLLLLQLSALIAYNTHKMMSYARDQLAARDVDSHTKESDLNLEHKPSIHKCPLCLSSASKLTATPCGHLFCWYCINDWTKVNFDCPVCRKDVHQSALIYLCQFDTCTS